MYRPLFILVFPIIRIPLITFYLSLHEDYRSFCRFSIILSSSVQLLGDLLFKVSGVSGKMTTDTAHEDDNFGTEHSQRVSVIVFLTAALLSEMRSASRSWYSDCSFAELTWDNGIVQFLART